MTPTEICLPLVRSHTTTDRAPNRLGMIVYPGVRQAHLGAALGA